MIVRLAVVWIFAAAATAFAADSPYGVLDIALGASYVRLQRDLDFRDINAAFAEMRSAKPDLGKRGYGCMPREDPAADVGCVSHIEKLDGITLREIRLHFLQGRLQQFSLSAEVQYYDAVIGYLRSRYGPPQTIAPANAGDEPTQQWQSELAKIVAFRGKDLVFVTFELASYADAVKRKRDGPAVQCT
jgi:hypothetical protein